MDFFRQIERDITNKLMCCFHSGRGYMRWWHSFLGVSAESGEQRTFFIEYFIRRGLQVTVTAGAFPTASAPGVQYRALYPISALRSAREPLVMQIEDCFYSDRHIFGRVKAIEWKLDVHKATAYRGGFQSNPIAGGLRLLECCWRGEGVHTFYRGQITLEGEAFDVSPETCLGYADRHWGRHASRPILQLNACALLSNRTGKALKHSALAIHDCRPRLLGFPLKRRLTVHLTYMGEDFTFGMASRCKWQQKETNRRHIWHILAQNKAAAVKLSYNSNKDEMMNLNRKYPLWSGTNGTGTIELYRRTPEGRQLLDTLTFRGGFWAWRGDVPAQ